MIDIAGLDKAEVLAALYSRAKPQGMGFIHYEPGDMPIEEARELLRTGDDRFQMANAIFDGHNITQTSFDYLKGRVMKVNIGGDSLNESLYDRDNGDGAAAAALAPLLAKRQALEPQP